MSIDQMMSHNDPWWLLDVTFDVVAGVEKQKNTSLPSPGKLNILPI